jgi:hypothetical protein
MARAKALAWIVLLLIEDLLKRQKGVLLMASVSPTAIAWQWPADLLAFAAQHQVQACLDPLLQVTRQLFPTARSLEVFLEADPEIRDDWHIVFDVRVPAPDIPDYLAAQHRWIDELDRCQPGPRDCIFRLFLIPVAP